MALWRRRKPVIPEWVMEATRSGEDQAAVRAWLDELEREDPRAYWAAYEVILSTPVWTKPDGPVAGD